MPHTSDSLYEHLVARLCDRYIANAKAFALDGQNDESASALMAAIEKRIDVSASRAPQFRRELMGYLGARAIRSWARRSRLRRTRVQLNGRAHVSSVEVRVDQGPDTRPVTLAVRKLTNP